MCNLSGGKMKLRLLITLLFCCAIALAGCSSKSKTGKAPEGGELKPESAHPGSGTAPGSNSNLKFAPPPGWVSETPSSSSRQAQYKLPRIQGDPEDAEVAVYYFSGGGGSTQSNVNRWIGQFTGPDGKSAPDSPKITHKTVGSISLTVVDVSGTYSSSMGMMQQSGGAKPNFRMIGVIAETESGPWFIKLTGPEKTVAKWESSFEAFLNSIHG
jgi:hypothetical protein